VGKGEEVVRRGNDEIIMKERGVKKRQVYTIRYT